MSEFQTKLKLIGGISVLAVGGYYLYSKWIRYFPQPDPKLGRVQIWQHPDAIKGSWQNAFVMMYDCNQKRYLYAYFADGMDFVLQSKTRLTKSDILYELELIKIQGYLPYSDDEIQQYKSNYGVQNLI